ncbi:MAG: hypothetical protein ACK4VK_05295, partial [Aquificaceae bacterium]
GEELMSPKRDLYTRAVLVDKILSITQLYDYLSNPQKQKEVKKLEKQIDQLVYKLYGLTDEEIKTVEGEG